jgi:hypothetical protein
VSAVHTRLECGSVECGIELVDGSPRGRDPLLQHHPVLGEHLARHRGVAGFKHLPDGFEWHVELAKLADDRGVGELSGRVRPVLGPRIDFGRHQQPGFVVGAQRFHRQRRRPREVADP